MIENTPRCRPCGNSLKSVEGCTFCLELKPLLIWPVFTEENDLSASEVINLTLRALKKRLKRLNKEIDSTDLTYNPALTRDLASVGRTLKELAAEQRKLEDREEDRYDKLGIEGRMELFNNEFFAVLPEDFQIRLLQLMKATYEKQNAPLLEESNE